MSEFIERIRKIEGIDCDKGVALCAGNEKVYEKALGMLYEKIPVMAAAMREHYASDFKTYVIEIHGMKSSLANVGADGLSKKALDLEVAGKAENMTFSDANFEPFLKELTAFGEEVAAAYSSCSNTSKTAGYLEFLKSELARLRQAIEDYEFDTADAVFENLAPFDFGAEWNGKLAKMKQLADAFDMDEVAELIDV